MKLDLGTNRSPFNALIHQQKPLRMSNIFKYKRCWNTPLPCVLTKPDVLQNVCENPMFLRSPL